MSSCFTEAQVQEAFLASPPLIAEQIQDLTVKRPVWMRDLYELQEFPRGNGAQMEQLVFRGAMPQIERGFKNWRKVNNISECDPCDGPDCSYNWTPFGGHGFERKIMDLMQRDFRSPEYCIKEIQTTAHFREVFAKIVENLYSQVDFFKEFNIGQNVLTELAKKFVVDSEGPKINTANPYTYPNIGTASLSALNINMLEFFYENMRRLPDVVPYDVIDGSPIYALEASHQLLARLYRDDPQLREDVRFSGLANDNLMKYNFMSTIRGMFIAAPILYPRRFNIDSGGNPVEVLPFVNGIPAERGAYTYNNPDYEVTTHEEVLIHGRYPFKIFYQPTESGLGANTSFGPEYSFMNTWSWINPLTECDPFRRNGYFATSATIGVSQQYSQGIYGILVARPSVTLMAMYNPVPECPPVPPSCDNAIPDTTCPCPVVLNIQHNPLAITEEYFFTFATPITGITPPDPITLVYDSGITVTGITQATNADGTIWNIFFPDGLPNGDCSAIVSVSCNPGTLCSSLVQQVSDCRSNQTGVVELTLSNAISADVGQNIVAFFGDCTSAELEIVAIEGSCLTYTVEYAAGFGPTDDPTGVGATVLSADMVCDRQGISKVCVPTATNADCGPCDTTLTPCVNP